MQVRFSQSIRDSRCGSWVEVFRSIARRPRGGLLSPPPQRTRCVDRGRRAVGQLRSTLIARPSSLDTGSPKLPKQVPSSMTFRTWRKAYDGSRSILRKPIAQTKATRDTSENPKVTGDNDSLMPCKTTRIASAGLQSSFPNR
jgi:hypothetical protein